MRVIVSFKNDRDELILDRALTYVLTVEEYRSSKEMGGFLEYTTNVSPMLVIASFEAEGILFSEFESIAFYPG
jgi:hypothetical protein